MCKDSVFYYQGYLNCLIREVPMLLYPPKRGQGKSKKPETRNKLLHLLVLPKGNADDISPGTLEEK